MSDVWGMKFCEMLLLTDNLKVVNFMPLYNASKLKYIIVCLEDRERSRAINVVDRLQTLGYPQDVYTCDFKGIRGYSSEVQICKIHWIYESALLYLGELDKYAMELNHRYTQGIDIKEDRKKCDYLIPLIRRIKELGHVKNLTDE